MVRSGAEQTLSQAVIGLVLAVLVLASPGLGVAAAGNSGHIPPASRTVGSIGAANTTGNSSSNASVEFGDVTVVSPDMFWFNGSHATWESSNLTVWTTVQTMSANSSELRLCYGDVRTDGNVTSMGCKQVIATPSRTVVNFETKATNMSIGQHRIVVAANETPASVSTNDTSIGGSTNDTSTNDTNGTVVNGSATNLALSNEIFVLNKTQDRDNDQLSNYREQQLGLNLTNGDTDGDGLLDGVELKVHGTDPSKKDTDGDGVPDNIEVNGPSNATKRDTDGDGVPDDVELKKNLDPTSAYSDEDTLNDSRELALGTDPLDADTDDDGLDDGQELKYGADPKSPDTDGDGVTDGREVSLGTDPTNVDSDGDMLRDGLELMIGLDPTSAIQTVVLLLGVVALIVGGGVLIYRSDRTGLTIDLPTDDAGRFTGSNTVGDSDGSDTRDNTENDQTPVELLTPPARVKRILDNNDGHVPQADIVEATDWSKAKVSRTLSKMEENEEISRYRLGRGNIVTHPDVDLTENDVTADGER